MSDGSQCKVLPTGVLGDAPCLEARAYICCVFLESMFIDQAIPYGTRPNSPAGAKPATADAAVLGLFGILVNLHWQSHHREQNPGPQAETRKALRGRIKPNNFESQIK
jgi:hypothetical protein